MAPSLRERFLRLWPLLLVLGPQAVIADPDDDAFREELLSLLAEQTELATKTRLNSDYVPGIIDVLRGDDLAARGARTVWEALGFVPGINPIIDQLGHPRVIVRGIGAVAEAWTSGYVKTLLNGVAVNTDDRGLADPVYFMPIAQVERIEVMRGPGSVVHGEHAVAGVINIITRDEESRVFAFTGSFDEVGGGTVLTGSQGELTFSLSASQWENSGADMMTGADGATTGSYAPGRANEGVLARNGIARIGFKGLSLLGQWSESHQGDYFGVNYRLPPDDDRMVEKSRIRQYEARYRTSISGTDIDLYLGDRNYRILKNHQLVVSETDPDTYVDLDYEERRRYLGTDIGWHMERHHLLLGLSTAEVEVEQGRQSVYLEGVPPAPGASNQGPVQEGTKRRIHSVVFQDEFRASDIFSLTTGVRYDEYSGVGSSLTPRVAGVWRFGENEVIKAQYGRAFRPPTLTESARPYSEGLPELKPVVIDTFEFGYIRKYPRGQWRITGAYSDLRDIILLKRTPPAPVYINADSGKLFSSEFQAEYQWSTEVATHGSVAYADTQLDEHDGPFVASSDVILQLGVKYRFPGGTLGNLNYRHVDGYARQDEDPRGTASGHDTVDLTLSTQREHGFSLYAGVKNLFDAQVRYPAFLLGSQTEPQMTYAEDLPRPGRTWWLQAVYRF